MKLSSRLILQVGLSRSAEMRSEESPDSIERRTT